MKVVAWRRTTIRHFFFYDKAARLGDVNALGVVNAIIRRHGVINNNEDEENESDEEEIFDLTPGWTAEDNNDARSLFE